MMQDVIEHGAGRKAQKLGRKDLAGKTGTTNEVRDSWFCGFQKDVVTVAWIGYDKFRLLGKRETGGQAGLGMLGGFHAQGPQRQAPGDPETAPGDGQGARLQGERTTGQVRWGRGVGPCSVCACPAGTQACSLHRWWEDRREGR